MTLQQLDELRDELVEHGRLVVVEQEPQAMIGQRQEFHSSPARRTVAQRPYPCIASTCISIVSREPSATTALPV
ncbi:hypothetical protein GCM10009786_12120 [Leucobacter alluvii]|uniref:Uncharacterized protein n=1 Tax=Leucobacter alluvii TaxID=340321 RepID=A0ABN3B4V3_9MICO